jgi:hypothetical protein|tara:strand:+ start:2781 stop:3137 length:357 start_codon:yes stop_codon:yes gene_type:complete
MNKELMSKIKEELVYVGILLVVTIIIFKIAFHNDNLMITSRMALAFFWMFVIPGFFMMYHWHEKLKFTERFIIGIVLSAAMIGISSYYLGILGVHIQYHGIILPLLYLIIGAILIFRK